MMEKQSLLDVFTTQVGQLTADLTGMGGLALGISAVVGGIVIAMRLIKPR